MNDMNCRVLFLGLGLLWGQGLLAQVYSGLWYGRAETNTTQTYNTYLCEFDIKKKGNNITGNLHYYFGSYEFSTPWAGKFWPATKTIELEPFPLITYFSRQQNDADCIMDGSLTLYAHEGDTTLYGQLNPVNQYRLGCPVMIVGLKKEKKEEDIFQDVQQQQDSGRVNLVLKETEAGNISSLSDPLLQRVFLPGPLIEVESDEVEMFLYDNAEIDMDTVSVYWNRKLLVDKGLLGSKALRKKLLVQDGENEIAMFAENLGRIPPNTALCMIIDGDQRHTIHLSSTLDANGTIRIRKKK
ncbi:MAG: hypothetical protein MUE71_09540 [Chitinophagaceae bacterium]|nr:hypothetical protein [Chitinophagaceae bacterium]